METFQTIFLHEQNIQLLSRRFLQIAFIEFQLLNFQRTCHLLFSNLKLLNFLYHCGFFIPMRLIVRCKRINLSWNSSFILSLWYFVFSTYYNDVYHTPIVILVHFHHYFNLYPLCFLLIMSPAYLIIFTFLSSVTWTAYESSITQLKYLIIQNLVKLLIRVSVQCVKSF